MADLSEEIEADRSTDLTECLQDGPCKHSVVSIVPSQDIRYLREEPDVIALVSLNSFAGFSDIGQIYVSLIQLDDNVNDHSVALLRLL